MSDKWPQLIVQTQHGMDDYYVLARSEEDVKTFALHFLWLHYPRSKRNSHGHMSLGERRKMYKAPKKPDITLKQAKKTKSADVIQWAEHAWKTYERAQRDYEEMMQLLDDIQAAVKNDDKEAAYQIVFVEGHQDAEMLAEQVYLHPLDTVDEMEQRCGAAR
jgi:hypothetical protein